MHGTSIESNKFVYMIDREFSDMQVDHWRQSSWTEEQTKTEWRRTRH